MFRILLVLVVIALGYDAIVHRGAYTRSVWYRLLDSTEQLVGGTPRPATPVNNETPAERRD
jgi:hypothetical protein